MRTASLFTLLLIVLSLKSQNTIATIEGFWENKDKSMVVQFYSPTPDVWNARIVRLSNETDDNGEPLRDVYNTNPSLRSRKVIGIDFISGLKGKPDNKRFTGGTIYYYKNGNHYNVIIDLIDDKTINVKGYWWFFRFLGSSNEWTKINYKK